MKLKELRDLLNNMGERYDDNEVCVEVFRANSMGGTPTVKVRSAFNGFDWNSGKFIMHTDIMLIEIPKEEKRDMIIDNILR